MAAVSAPKAVDLDQVPKLLVHDEAPVASTKATDTMGNHDTVVKAGATMQPCQRTSGTPAPAAVACNRRWFTVNAMRGMPPPDDQVWVELQALHITARLLQRLQPVPGGAGY